MNIIHSSSQKFVPNNIFNHVTDHQHDYFHEKNNSTHDYDKQNISASSKKGIQLKIPPSFQDKFNLKNESNQNDITKPTTVMDLIPQKVNIRSSSAEECGQEIFEVHLNQSEIVRKPKHKKKVSPRKNNLKQLFDEIYQKADNDCIFVQNDHENNSKTTKSTNQNLQSNQKELKIHENKKFQREKREKRDIEQNQPSPCESARQEQNQSLQNNNTSPFKINKFHFLHNDLNLDSSSEEDGEESSKDTSKNVRQSSSSQNDEDKVDFEIPKIRSRNNFFIKKEDLNLDDDSDDSDEGEKEEQIIEQVPQQKDHFTQQKQQNTEKNLQEKSSQRTLTVTEFRREFVNSDEEYLKKPLPNGVTLDLIIKRNKSKKDSDLIEYQLYDLKTLRMIIVVSMKSGVHEIMAKKNVQDPKAHPDVKYLTAKLQSNFLGSEFILKYVPRANQQSTKISKSPQKQQLAATVCYETNILGLKGPRKMNIFIPENDSVKYYGDKSLEQLYEKKCNHRIEKYVNKQAKWNKEVQSYVLNLKGKARLSSVKNFVIVKDSKGTNSQEEEKAFVIFGKVSKEIFNLSISGPFSIIQGLSLAISTFERKFICE